MFRSSKLPLIFAILLLSTSIFATEPEPAPAAVGQVISETVAIDGVVVPSGTALLAPTTLATSQQPAAIHLIGGHTVELARNSAVQLNRSSDTVQLLLQDGTLSFKGPEGSVETVAAPSELVIADGSLSVARSPIRGAVAVIMGPVAEDSLEFTVNDSARLKLDQPVLVWDRDKPLETSEVHCIRKVEANKVQTAEPVSSEFEGKTLLVQGAEVERAIESGARVIGQTAPAILAGGCAAIAASAFPSAGLGATGIVAGTTAAGATSAV
ncbi:MAG TPA: hypothetical protein VKZ59_14050, partial [Acidobacteriota bacterium]|nr:hypothetical protein [Acidobacteriota bacterium]